MKVISLFSGVGGLDLGFIKAKHSIVWANDIFDDAVETYKNNIGNHIVNKDIAKIKIKEIPQADIVIGGFPCQGFSVANMNRNTNDTRNNLYKEFVRIVKGIKPKFFLAENVKGILSFNNGETFKVILNDFSKAGYNVSYQVLNAANYGVPQKRERVIIVGVRRDVDFKYNFPKPTHSEMEWVTVKHALENIPDPDSTHMLFNHEYSKFKMKFNGYLGNRKTNPDNPAPTITARGDSKGGVVVIPHYNNKRRMTCREIATIQSFPTNFKFTGTKSSIYRQIANAVPPVLAYCVAKNFKQ